jgi:hypothetical protein
LAEQAPPASPQVLVALVLVLPLLCVLLLLLVVGRLDGLPHATAPALSLFPPALFLHLMLLLLLPLPISAGLTHRMSDDVQVLPTPCDWHLQVWPAHTYVPVLLQQGW